MPYSYGSFGSVYKNSTKYGILIMLRIVILKLFLIDKMVWYIKNNNALNNFF